MYGIDEDLAKAFDAKKYAEKQQIPFLPSVEFTGQLLIKRITKGNSPKRGKFYQFTFDVVKANDERILPGARYCLRFYPGASQVDNEIFWRNVVPVLMAAVGETDVLKFVPAQHLGEFTQMSTDADGKPGVDLDLLVGIVQKLESPRPDKNTSKLDPKHFNEDGSVKKYARATWSPAATAQ